MSPLSRQHRILFLAACAVVAIAAVIYVVRRLRPAEPAPFAAAAPVQEKRIPITLRPVARERIARTLVLTGGIEPFRQAQVAAKVSGRVEKVLAETGSRVAEGAPLLVLDARDLSLQVEQARSERDAARARADELRRGAREEEIAQAEAALERARKRFSTQEADLARTRKLKEEGVVSESYLEKAEAAHQDALSEVKISADHLSLLRKGATPEQLAGAEAAARSANVRLDLSQEILSQATVSAPFAGIIARKLVEVGEVVSPGRPLFLLYQMDRIRVRIAAPERLAAEFRPGDELTVDPGPAAGSLRGKVSRVNPALDPASRTMEVEAVFDNPRLALKPGGFVKVVLVPESREDALTVPIDALSSDGSTDYVYVVSGDRAAKRPVKVGIRGERMAEVMEGVTEGEMVAVGGAGRLKDRSAVRVVEP